MERGTSGAICLFNVMTIILFKFFGIHWFSGLKLRRWNNGNGIRSVHCTSLVAKCFQTRPLCARGEGYPWELHARLVLSRRKDNQQDRNRKHFCRGRHHIWTLRVGNRMVFFWGCTGLPYLAGARKGKGKVMQLLHIYALSPVSLKYITPALLAFASTSSFAFLPFHFL